MQQTQLLGVPVTITDTQEIIENVKKAIDTNEKFLIIAINPKKVIFAKENPNFMEIIKDAQCLIPDGVAVVKACKEKINRITGIDTMDKICEQSSNFGGRIFLYGAKKEIVNMTKENLIKKYPEINIVGICDGYEKDDMKIVESINKANANIVFVAKGSPIQEEWMHKWKNKINAPILMGVGGSFDVISGKIARAPKIFRRLGLEWMYRMLREPKRLKQMPIYFKFGKLLKKERRNK